MVAALPGVTVAVNAGPDKPRKGVFCVTVAGKEIFCTGPEARPFPKLKAMDCDAVAALVTAALQQ